MTRKAHFEAMNKRIDRELNRRADRTEPTSFTVPKPSRCEEDRDNRPIFSNRETIIVWILAAFICVGVWYGAFYAGCCAWSSLKGFFA